MMEADNCENGDLAIPVMTSKSFDMVTLPVKKQSSRIREIASGCVFWLGMALIGVVAVPAGILFGMIYLIVRGINFLTDKISND